MRKLDEKCRTCRFGRLKKSTAFIGSTLYCSKVRDECKVERSPEGRCGPEAIHYRLK